jgi:hypothetical protein
MHTRKVVAAYIDDVGLVEEMLEKRRELANLVHVGFDQGQDGFLHFIICNSVQLLPLEWTRISDPDTQYMQVCVHA